ncbi:MAG TPA: hydantoinase/oxoprolinase family protein [Silvibacterium sp.]|nr:hydantoinase/oxoprolinase family protein [Silvibacterium sp.]
MSVIRIGVDTGGTFTDLLLLDDRGLRVHKLRSIPEDPSQAILEGIRTLLQGSGTDASLEVTHGSTVATNAVLERKGALIALITTAGFEDVLAIGRQTRPELYNFNVIRPEPLVPRERIFGLGERLAYDGSVLLPINPTEVESLITRLRVLLIESVAICFLHSYANPAHEREVAAALRSAGFRVSASYEVLPEYREYERWATTAVNAYVAPLMTRYLDRLHTGLTALRPETSLRIMQSNGGSISAPRAAQEAVQTILSGPAAGVVGAQAIGNLSGFTRLITFDMGGTSTDVSLVDGSIGTTNESVVGDLPVRLPVLDIHSVGAGGGSIAWIDSGGSLRVGPRSAGAQPGPACFGTGADLTVTDANLLLGRLDPSFFLGGRMTLDLARTERLAGEFAASLNLTPSLLAEGILRIANANMERAVRVVSVQRGFDPRDFALLAFGGAGGLHACALADSLEIATILVPEHAGVLSALGMLLADVVKDYSASMLAPLTQLKNGDLRMKANLDVLRKCAVADLSSEGFGQSEIMLAAALSMRYSGQSFEIDVPCSDEECIESLEARFHELHQQRYGYSNPQFATEAVQLRLRGTGRTWKPQLSAQTKTCASEAKPHAVRDTVFHGQLLSTQVFRRTELAPGAKGKGPALIVSGESTTAISPSWQWRIDDSGTLVVRKGGHS